MAMWKLLKDYFAPTEADLRRYVEEIDLLDGKRDEKVDRSKGAVDCQKCKRRILKTAPICVHCGSSNNRGDSFHGT